MSRRGRATGAAISLFSFQDIITSVTAIMILIVLILTLELAMRSQQRGMASEDRKVARDLRGSVDRMERQAEAMRAEVAGLQADAKGSASFSEQDTRLREQEAAEHAARLAEEISLLESQVRAAASARRRVEAEFVSEQSSQPRDNPAHIEAMNARAAAIEASNRAERDRQKVAKDAPPVPTTPTLVFNPASDSSLQPRLLDVKGDGLAVLEGSGELRRFPTAGRTFDRWLGSLDAKSEYVVIILRPSGVRHYDTVLEKVKAAGLEVGSELVGESMPVALGKGS